MTSNGALAVLAAAALGVSLASAARAEPLPLVIHADTVMGGQCVLSNQFKPGDLIVWRAKVTDTQTGAALGDDTVASVVVSLPDGSKYEAHFGQHPPENSTDTFWSVSWPVPDDYPTGTFTYKIVATAKDGRTATFEPFKVVTSQLTIAAAK